MKRIIVTGGSGKLGRATVKDLRANGYDVVNADISPPSEPDPRFVRVDFEDLNDTMDAFAGWDWGHTRQVDGVVHLAAIPAPGRVPAGEVMRVNTMSTYNVFETCRRLGIKNIVWASSETLLGSPFVVPPRYLPVDEEYPARPKTAYSLSKLLGEEMARQFCEWDPEVKIVGLRFSNVKAIADYDRFPEYEADPASRRFNLWSYVDARDAAQAVRKALEADIKGADVFVIANDDTAMTTANSELLREYFPDVSLKRSVGDHDSLLSSEKAKRILGYRPEFGWRDGVERR